MKKISLIISIYLVTLFVISGSLFAAQLNPTPDNPVTIRIGTTDKVDDLSVGLEYTMCKVFEAMVETNSGGAIQVQIFPSGQLGTVMNMLEAVQAGEIETCTGTAGVPSF